MYSNLFLIVSTVLFISVCTSYGQEIANKQCDTYISQLEKIQSEKEIHKPSRRRKRIVGGTTASPSEFPFMAALGFKENNEHIWACGGTLINEKFILTAAQCANSRTLGPPKVVRLGTSELTKPAQDVPVKKIHIHPQYVSQSVYNDIALVELETKVNFSSSLFPACLHTDSKKIDGPVIAMGWGKVEYAGGASNDLLKVSLSIISPEECNKAYLNTSKMRLKNGIQSDTQICAGSADDTPRDTCQGDSGGPIEIQNGKKHVVVGITSFGKACGITKSPAVYTRVSAFIPWLESIAW